MAGYVLVLDSGEEFGPFDTFEMGRAYFDAEYPETEGSVVPAVLAATRRRWNRIEDKA